LHNVNCAILIRVFAIAASTQLWSRQTHPTTVDSLGDLLYANHAGFVPGFGFRSSLLLLRFKEPTASVIAPVNSPPGRKSEYTVGNQMIGAGQRTQNLLQV
jgi:hypothetical protein